LPHSPHRGSGGRRGPTNWSSFPPKISAVVTGIRSTRNHAYLVFDTLYGIDTSWTAQPQMVEGHQVEEDGLTWTLTLRDGLRFHDKEPVLARDVVASIRRFCRAHQLRRCADDRNRGAVGARRSHRAVPSETAVFRICRKLWPGREALFPPSCQSVWRRPRHSSRLRRSS
jgi:peptide/nickel transport system substrate-binding protein